MRTYNQTPDGPALTSILNKHSSESDDGRLYRIEYVKRSRTTGNDYTVSTVGYKNGAGYISINNTKNNRITRYRVSNPSSVTDIGPMVSSDVRASILIATEKAKAGERFKKNLGSVAKSLDW